MQKKIFFGEGSELLQNVAVAKLRKYLSKVVGGKAVTKYDVCDAVKKRIF